MLRIKYIYKPSYKFHLLLFITNKCIESFIEFHLLFIMEMKKLYLLLIKNHVEVVAFMKCYEQW